MARCARVVAVLALALGLGAASATASVMDLRELVAADASLLHHYTFEGDTTAQRREDKASSLDLSVSAYGSGTGVSYAAGFDITSTALRPQVVNAANGAGLQASGFAVSNTITVEALVAPNGSAGGTYQYALAGSGSPTRAYFLFIDKNDGDLELATGNTSFSDGNAQRNVVANFKPGHWYYVASTFQNSGGNTIVNSYVADLSAGDTTLTQTLTNSTIGGTYGTASNLGVGMFGGAANEALDGKLDEVAIYNGAALSQATLQGHLDALLEPSATNVASMRAGVANTPGLIHHYTFEGNATERLEDKVGVGGVDLEAAAYGSQGSTAAIDYVVGLDSTTKALVPQRLSRSSTGPGGAALRTVANVGLPSTLTVEAILCPENLEAGGAIGYAVEGRGAPSRAYFLAQIEQGGDDSIATIIGDNFSQPDNRREIIDPFIPGHWYYVVNTYEESGGNTIINSYIADLTAGDTVLQQVLDGVIASGTFSGSDRMGIGGFAGGASTFQEAWAGSLDEIALYDRVLDRATMQGHLWRLTQTPEPGTLTLLAIGGIGALVRRRRRRK